MRRRLVDVMRCEAVWLCESAVCGMNRQPSAVLYWTFCKYVSFLRHLRARPKIHIGFKERVVINRHYGNEAFMARKA